jgi:glycosyltransferase involved in cell wall biosynthesis
METKTRQPDVNGTAAEAEQAPPRQIIGRFLAPATGAEGAQAGTPASPRSTNEDRAEGAQAGTPASPRSTNEDRAEGAQANPRSTNDLGSAVPVPQEGTQPPGQAKEAAPTEVTPLAVFCAEPPDSFLGGHVARVIAGLTQRGIPVHLFARHSYEIEGAQVHVVGADEEGDVVDQAQEYTRHAGNAFMQQFPGGAGRVRLLGYEWSAVPVLSLLRGLRNLDYTLSLHSLERQRSDLSSDVARRIETLEMTGLREARTLLLHDPATGEVARQGVPECVDRATQARTLFPVWNFEANLDPGAIKARYQVGPIDPLILFIGDLSERYGPDLALKAMPAVLRHHPQARLVIVGDGSLYWPLRVYARYLLLEHAVRLVGHVQDQPLHELIQAADLVIVPSRESTPWWPIQAAWAARRPVVATHEAARPLLAHEQDAVLVYPSENSCVWGIERVLYDADLRTALGRNGRQKLDERFGWNALAAQVDELTGARV